ncbi:S8 family serine peptidase [Gracilimonas sp.]|uniref:S8 family serine peptidase n=1 Tax=Gracilimonas sp. TaxID=1974203 RepID=UPI0025BB2F98|nr:S8 family serine peptidase [Gracilimonas sp.]
MLFKNQFENRISEAIAQQSNVLIEQVRQDFNIRKDSIMHRYKYALKGFSAKLTKNQVEALEKDARILKVKPNKLYSLGYIKNKTRLKSDNHVLKNNLNINQTIPWGVTRVGGPLDGTGKKAWILDTGIDLDHPDLNVDVANSVSFIATEPADDGNGHGTHVAGIIAAKNNSQDVVGVAAGATVVAIKVCYDESPGPGEDQCPESSLLNGIDYITNNAAPGDVVNISIWGPIDTDLDNAVINAANNGVRLTLISGNAGSNANDYSPGRANHSNIWTVSAHDNNDNFASFSNYGNPPIEYSNPGVDIPSLWKNGNTKTIDGTSMAAPHVAGILLATGQEPYTNKQVNNDPDSNPDPIASSEPYVGSPYVIGSVQNDHPKLDWSATEGAYEYEIHRKVGSSTTWGLWATISSTSYVDMMTSDPDLRVMSSPPSSPDGWVAYKVRAVHQDGFFSFFSNIVYYELSDGTIVPHSTSSK